MPPSADHWRRFPPTEVIDGCRAVLYESKSTGLRGVLVETGEPLCSLHVAIATEADTNEWSHKDDGLPHTLEHAIFLGSELYPYKGILDKLANRCLAQGTNAWTATDHTCYTLETAGHEGCLNLLPVFADHILYATMTDEAFLTEVHHVTPAGEDKGVVYCEMQGRENKDGSLVDRAVLSLLYPSGGYSAETGGMLANLRTLTNAQVRRYHAENYRPSNTLFVVSGTASESEFISALEIVDARIRAKPAPPPAERRPWSAAVAPMVPADGVLSPPLVATADASRVLHFPSDDESVGTVSMAWRGPPYGAREEWAALMLLWKYLTVSAVSPLQKVFVECAAPLCARVSACSEVFTDGYHQVWFREAKVDTIDSIPSRLFAAIDGACDDFDLDRMRVVIRRARRRLLEKVERKPTDAIIDPIIRHFLYGPRAEESAEKSAEKSAEVELAALVADVDERPAMAAVEEWPAQKWVSLMRAYMLDRPCAAVIGKPSAARAKEIAEEDTSRQAAQAADLGPDRLAELGAALDAAVIFNEREIPDGVLERVPIPSLASVRGVPVLTVRGPMGALEVAENSGDGVSDATRDAVLATLRGSAARADPAVGQYWIDWNHIDSNFVAVAVAMDTCTLEAPLRMYLPLLLELMWKLPCALDDGTELSKDEFVAAVQEDTVKYSADLGLVSGLSKQWAHLFVQAPRSCLAYRDAVELDGGAGLGSALKWVRRALFLTRVTADDAAIGARRLLAEIPAVIRNGSRMAAEVLAELECDEDVSNLVARDPMRQQPFLIRALADLDAGGARASAVVDDLERLRAALTAPDRLKFFVAANLPRLDDPYARLAEATAALACVPIDDGAAPPVAAPPASHGATWRVLSGRQAQAAVVALSAIESTFVFACAPGVGAYDDDEASLLVAAEYLTALEGDFWVKLRGPGLTYSYGLRNNSDSRRLRFSLFKATDAVSCFAAAREIVVGYASGQSQIAEIELDGAKSALAYSIIEGTATKLDAASAAWECGFNEKGVDYTRWLLAQVAAVTVDDVLHALRKYIVALFDPIANVVFTCPTSKQASICAALAERGAEVRAIAEDGLCAHFGGSEAVIPTAPPPGASRLLPGDFASQFKCGCPKCVR